MKNILLTSAATIMVVTSAHAQEAKTPFTLKAGINYLTTGTSRDATKATGFDLGVSYLLPADAIKGFSFGKLSVDLDFVRNSGNGNKIESFNLNLVDRFPFSKGVKAGAPTFYGGLGVGVAYGKVDASRLVSVDNGSGGTTTSRQSFSDKAYRIGGTALVGLEFGGRYNLEAAYNFRGKISGVDTSALSVTVGIRF